MHGSSTSELDTASPRLTWSDYNECGLASAADGAWEEASIAFCRAADELALESDVASHEALALVLNNLAYGCYRAGRVEDAIPHAQRACALRVALVGEDASTVARARTDLAVMLAASGRAEEAMALVIRAIAGIERSAGDEALQLSYVLENAARLAMSVGQPSTAEPYLLRLHALLAVHELPTDRADALLAGISRHRAQARHAFGLPVVEVRGEEVAAEPAAVEQSADERLHVEEITTDVVEAIETPETDASEIIADPLDELTIGDIALNRAPKSPSILGLDFELVELASVGDDTAAPAGPPASVPAQAVDVLGFEVRYGTQTDEEASLAEIVPVRPTATRIPTPVSTPVLRATTSDTKGAMPSQDSTDNGMRERRIRRPNIRWGRASIPRSPQGLLLVGMMTSAFCAALGWMILAP